MSIKRWNVVGLGEVLWDVFPDGPRFGGAPANFACCCAQLLEQRADVVLFSGVGEDLLGDRAIHHLKDRGVNPHFVQKNSSPTGQVFVSIDERGNATYRFLEDCAWDKIIWNEDIAALAMHVDILCFGTLGQRVSESRSSIRTFVDSVPTDCLKILDLNLRTPFWDPEVLFESLSRCNVLKLNEHELPVLADLLNLRGSDETILLEIQRLYSLHLVAYTLGEKGSILLAETFDQKPSEKVSVIDTVGAGDAFTAALVAGIIEFRCGEGARFSIQSPTILSEIHAKCSQVAGFVAGSAGATPALPKSLGFPQ